MNSEISYQPNFITEQQEREILSVIPNIPDMNLDSLLCKRFRFGKYVHPYNTNYVSEIIPEIFNNINIALDFNSITINEFEKNHIIPFHIDPIDAGEEIYVLSLCGRSEIAFRDSKGNTKLFNIEPKSLYIMRGDLRYNWQHSAKALERRLSIVFRKSLSKQNDR